MINQSVIMASGYLWSIMKFDDQPFSIMKQADSVLNEIVNICIFCW